MLRKPTISNVEREFVVQAIKQGVRVDGRTNMDFRAINITFSDKAGQVDVQLGQTRVLASVTADVVEPFADRPAEGFLSFYADFSPMASPFFESGKPNEQAVELSRVIERGIRDSRALDTEALCIIAGKKVWSVRCDIHVVDHQGNLADCANLATVAALLHFRRPDVTVVGDTVTVHAIEERPPVPLSLHHIPICVSFAFFAITASQSGSSASATLATSSNQALWNELAQSSQAQSLCVLDPSLKEELCMRGSLTFTLNAHKEICCIQKAGGAAVPVDQILKCGQQAATKAGEITALLNSLLKKATENAFESSVKSGPPPPTGPMV